MARRRISNERILLGVAELDEKLMALKQGTANRVARSGLIKGARLAAQKIKHEVPGHLKTVRAAIGHSVKQTRFSGRAGRWTLARAGAAVGLPSSNIPRARRSTRDGVGMSTRNLHWFIMGTKDRFRKDGSWTGRMPKFPAVKRAMAKYGTEIMTRIAAGAREQLDRELRKLAKKP